MGKRAYDKIAEGLQEAIAIVRGGRACEDRLAARSMRGIVREPVSEAEMSEPIIVNHPQMAFILQDGEGTLLPLPSFADDEIKELLKVADRLPEGFGFILDGQARHTRVFQVKDAALFDALKRSIVKDSTSSGVNNDLGGEAREGHVEHDEADDFSIVIVRHGRALSVGVNETGITRG